MGLAKGIEIKVMTYLYPIINFICRYHENYDIHINLGITYFTF